MGFTCLVYTDNLGRLSPANVTDSSCRVVLMCSKTWKNTYLGRMIRAKKRKRKERMIFF